MANPRSYQTFPTRIRGKNGRVRREEWWNTFGRRLGARYRETRTTDITRAIEQLLCECVHGILFIVEVFTCIYWV